jgi:uncharacterized protein YhdP
MISRRKIVIRLITGLFAVLILMTAIVLLAPKVIDTKWVKDVIRSHFQKELDGTIDFTHVRLDLYPSPRVMLDQVSLSMPDVVSGKADSVSISPNIPSLLSGKVQIDSLRIESADLDYTLTKKAGAGKQDAQPFSLHELGKKVQAMVSALPEPKIPELDFQVTNSRVKLFNNGRQFLALNAVNSHLEGPATRRQITLNCKSDLWQSIAINGLLNTITFKGSGKVQLTQFQPQGLAAEKSADDSFQVTDAPADLTIDLKTEGSGQLQADVHGASPHLKFKFAKKELDFKNPRIKAAFSVDNKSLSLSLSELAMDNPRLKVTAKLTLEDMPGKSENMNNSQSPMTLDMDINAETIDLIPLINAMQKISAQNDGTEKPGTRSTPIQGNIRFKADRFSIGKFTWNPVHADIKLHNDTADITLKEAAICGISTPGTLKLTLPVIEFDLEADARDRDLDPTRTCLVGKTFKADGTFNLKGGFQGRGKAAELLKNTTGQVEFTATDGHIYQDIFLLNLMTFLNTLEVLEGRVDVKDMKKKGFAYHSYRMKIKMQDGRLQYEEAVLHGQPMTVTGAGHQDLQNGRFDLTLLVAPLVTLDNIFEHIPLVGGILHTLDTIPLGVSGTMDTIHFSPLAPSAIGFELKEMMNNTIERPINLIHGKKTSD